MGVVLHSKYHTIQHLISHFVIYQSSNITSRISVTYVHGERLVHMPGTLCGTLPRHNAWHNK